MNSDLFEKNIGKLVRQAALPTADASRARERFLAAAEPSPLGLSWILPPAAAALFLAVAAIGVLRSDAPSPPTRTELEHVAKAPQDLPTEVGILKGTGGNELLQGTLTMDRGTSGRWAYVFRGRSPLPEALIFKLQGQMLEESFDGRRLVSRPTPSFSGTSELEKGTFQSEWTSLKGGPFQLSVTAPDDLQEKAVLAGLKIPQDERTWSFTYQAWDDRLLPKIESQYREILGLIIEAQQLVRSAAAPAVAQPRPEDDTTSRSVPVQDTMNALMSELRKLLSRFQGFSASGLYPASTAQATHELRDLTGAIPYFQWKDGKFAGVQDYHRQNAPSEFSFEGILARLNAAAVVAGREFDLWILRDTARGGLRKDLVETVRRNAERGGVAEFADALKAGTAKEEDIRQIAK